MDSKVSLGNKLNYSLFLSGFFLFFFVGCSSSNLEKIDLKSLKEQTKEIKNEDLEKIKENLKKIKK